MSKLRHPNGKFLSSDAALGAWLPLMLDWIWRDPIVHCLTVMIRYCEERAAREFERSAKFIRDPKIQTETRPEMYWHNVKEAEEWRDIRAALVEARAKVREITEVKF